MAKTLGQFGEDIAAEFLSNSGFKVIGRNIVEKIGEIDIVAKELDTAIICLIEVKTLMKNDNFAPEGNYNPRKQQKVQKLAQLFAGKHSALIGPNGYRVDLVAVEIMNPLLTDWRKDCIIRHYKNV